MKHFYKDQHLFGGKKIDWFDFDDVYKEEVKHATEGDHFVEIGVCKGRSAAFMAVEIINSDKKIRFDAIDNFAEYSVGVARQNLNAVFGHVNIISSDSSLEANSYEDESLDFIFIDGDHRYQGVMKDLKAWYPKLKPKKRMVGHDFCSWTPRGGKVDVYYAVIDFCEENNLKWTEIPNRGSIPHTFENPDGRRLPCFSIVK